MIARMWHGYTKPEDADAYESTLKPELLPGISKVPGYRGGYVLRRSLEAEVEFITIMIWDRLMPSKQSPDQTTPSPSSQKIALNISLGMTATLRITKSNPFRDWSVSLSDRRHALLAHAKGERRYAPLPLLDH